MDSLMNPHTAMMDGKTIMPLLRGAALLNDPIWNRGAAFTHQERAALGLTGLLPCTVETIADQATRVLEQLGEYETPDEQSIFLMELLNTNETLFYYVLLHHPGELLPIVYTPGISAMIKRYSHRFRRPRGLYITYDDIDRIDEVLSHRPHDHLDVVVVTDSSGILGIGDQGVGGIGITTGKLLLDVMCGAARPERTLGIALDVGTDSQTLLDDPLYMGWRNHRLDDATYFEFIERFVDALHAACPGVLLHWEDIATPHAQQVLERTHRRVCSYNDDIHGTGVVVLGTILSAMAATGSQLADQRIVIYGAGCAGIGSADIISQQVEADGGFNGDGGIWAIDIGGLLHEASDFNQMQAKYVRSTDEVASWVRNDEGAILLDEVVRRVKPTVLIGASSDGGAFTKEIIQEMAAHVTRPIVLPLSNPTAKSEAIPQDVHEWTQGRAIVATGSPFGSIPSSAGPIRVAQCNNVFSFPGVTLAKNAVGATEVTESMLLAAASALASCSPMLDDPGAPPLPPVENARGVAHLLSHAIATVALEEGVATHHPTESITLQQMIDATQWTPAYAPLV